MATLADILETTELQKAAGGFVVVWWNKPDNLNPADVGNNFVAFQKYSGVESGKCNAQALGESLGGKGNVIGLAGVEDSTTSQTRVAGFKDGASLASAMSHQTGGRPKVSAVRASALFSLEDVNQACLAIAGLLGTLGGAAGAFLEAPEMVRAMSDWDRERRRLAFRYHRANAPKVSVTPTGAAPSQPPTPEGHP